MRILFYSSPEVKDEVINDFIECLKKKYNINQPIYKEVITDSHIQRKITKKYDYSYKILSESTQRNQYTDLTWTLPATIVMSNENKTHCYPTKKTAQIISCGRTATLLFNKVLERNYKVVIPYAHILENVDLSKLSNTINEEKIFTEAIRGDDIYFMYRKDWFEHFTSALLGEKFGFNHEDSYNYKLHAPIKINVQQEVDSYVKGIFTYFNTICNYTKLHKTKFKAIITSEDIVSYYGKLGIHKRINYGRPKKEFFTQYNKMKKYIEYASPLLDDISQNALDKLRQMNVLTIKNLDEIL